MQQNDNLDYAAIRRQVEAELQQKRYQRQLVLFLLSGFIFLLVLVMILVALPDSSDFINRDSLLSVVYFMAAGWVIALIFHALSTFLVNSPGWARRMRRRLTAQTFEDTMLDADVHLAGVPKQKAKRQQGDRLRLSDEGELLDITQEQWPDDKLKREDHHA